MIETPPSDGSSLLQRRQTLSRVRKRCPVAAVRQNAARYRARRASLRSGRARWPAGHGARGPAPAIDAATLALLRGLETPGPGGDRRCGAVDAEYSSLIDVANALPACCEMSLTLPTRCIALMPFRFPR